MNSTIYKILTAEQWKELQANQRTAGAPIDVADGFVHFSTAEQVEETAKKHFHGQEGLVLAAFNAEDFGDDLRWEPSRGGDLFPHLYGELPLNRLIWSKPLDWVNGKHEFPALSGHVNRTW